MEIVAQVAEAMYLRAGDVVVTPYDGKKDLCGLQRKRWAGRTQR